MDWQDKIISFISFLFIFGTILGLAYVTTKMVASASFKKFKNKNMRLIEALALGPQKALELVQVGEKIILIAVTKDNIFKIDTFNPDELEVNIQNVEGSNDILKNIITGFIKSSNNCKSNKDTKIESIDDEEIDNKELDNDELKIKSLKVGGNSVVSNFRQILKASITGNINSLTTLESTKNYVDKTEEKNRNDYENNKQDCKKDKIVDEVRLDINKIEKDAFEKDDESKMLKLNVEKNNVNALSDSYKKNENRKDKYFDESKLWM